MSFTGWMPPAPESVTATPQNGGSLDANTTYYVVVVAVAKYNNSRTSSPLWDQNIYSPYSSEISFTTTATERSALITWDKVYKPSPYSVEVDGYAVLVSKIPGIANLKDDAVIYASTSYYNLSTYTNSYTLTANPTIRFHNIRYGVPYVYSSGTTKETISGLATFMQTNYPNHIQEITTPGGNHIGWKIVCWLDLYSVSGDYCFECTNELFMLFGGFYNRGKVNFEGSYVTINTSGHANGSYFFFENGSNLKNAIINPYYYGSLPILSTATRTWSVGLSVNKLSSADNLSGCVFVPPNSTSISYSNPSIPNVIGRKNLLIGYNYSQYEYITIDFVKNNPFYFQRMPPGTQQVGASGMASRVLYDNNDPNHYTALVLMYLDCYWIWNNNAIWGTTYGWKPLLSVDYANYNSRYSISFWRSIFVHTKDEYGNPVTGARVSFWSIPRGTNLTHGNNSNQMVKQRPDALSSSNWEYPESTKFHNDPYLWLYDFNNNGGTSAPRYVSLNTPYWSRDEKIIFTGQLSDTPYKTGVTKFSCQRGVDNTVVSWKYSSTYAYDGLYFAPDYHETDSNGFTWNPTLVDVYKRTTKYSPVVTNSLDYLVANGYFESCVTYAPVKVRVEKSGYEAAEVIVDHNTLEHAVTNPVILNITLKRKRFIG